MPHRSAAARHDPGRTAVVTSIDALSGVRAGSALVRVDDRLLLAQDDDYTLVWLRLPLAAEPEFLPLRDSSGAMAKQDKPDFEAATTLPDGRILVIGSGSAQPRRAVVLLDPTTNTFDVRDAGRLYDLTQAEVGHELNL